ncbi:MAG: transglycosylase SLT domain-containing protein [gamma proteobacterium symbiont of Bathyaustriella thionipta]|nr:transglycosylase SLT domain-containing protein [gamma proteobacterium symbiont of Bathyaustriella thionipta]
MRLINSNLCFLLAALLLLSGCNSLMPKTSAVDSADKVGPPLSATETPENNSNPGDELPQVGNKAQPDSHDLWSRVRKNMQLDRQDNERIAAERRWILKHPEYLQRVQERAEPYLYYIVSQIEERKLPAELALLPVVESSYNPFAYSPSRASGLWQFMPSTGMYFGLKQNWWYDGRRDVRRSTHAALSYLRRLNNRFNGDWELALAAYNAGGGRVSQALKKARTAGKSGDFWSLKLPRETRNYVPRLLAVAQLIAEPEKYAIHLRDIPDQPGFEVADSKGQIDLAIAAKLAGIGMQELYRLNPAYNRWASDPDGPFELLLPVGKADDFQQKIANLPADKRMQWTRYRIAAGDTLGGIARKHRTSVSAIKSSNKLRGSHIRAGHYLLIPGATAASGDYVLSQSQRQAKRKQSGSGTKIQHSVRSGENLWTISRHYGTSHKQLAGWNGLALSEPLHPGQTLIIWKKKVKPAGLPLNNKVDP